LRVSTVRNGYVRYESRAIDPASVRLAAGTIAWREGPLLQLRHLVEDDLRERVALTRFGDVRLTVGRRALYAQRGDGPRIKLASALNECESSSGCGGSTSMQLAGAYLATVYLDAGAGESQSWIVLNNLAGGKVVSVCELGYESGLTPNEIGSYVVTDTGGVACATESAGRRQIRTATATLDEGPGIDTTSLTRRGDQLVWLHDGVEKTAPLPTPA
jgi:hypothetical protein